MRRKTRNSNSSQKLLLILVKPLLIFKQIATMINIVGLWLTSSKLRWINWTLLAGSKTFAMKILNNVWLDIMKTKILSYKTLCSSSKIFQKYWNWTFNKFRKKMRKSGKNLLLRLKNNKEKLHLIRNQLRHKFRSNQLKFWTVSFRIKFNLKRQFLNQLEKLMR